MGGLDPTKIFLILVIALIVVGPERLPGLARQLGGMWRELNRMREKFEQEVRAAVPDLDLPNIPTSPSRAITGYLTGLVSGQDTTAAGAAAGAEQAVAEPAYSAVNAGPGRGRRVSRQAQGLREPTRSTWQPLLGRQGSASTRRPPSVPSSSWASSLGADTVFVVDEPSMN
ncbi:MAG: twin-arginine translocase TatA/TatE family subunit [Acidimicrobiales bacterium]|jgi:Sec-independent protein translocase protein TatA